MQALWDKAMAKSRRRQGRNRLPHNPRLAREALVRRRAAGPVKAPQERPQGYIRLTCHNLPIPDSDPIPGYVPMTLHEVATEQ